MGRALYKRDILPEAPGFEEFCSNVLLARDFCLGVTVIVKVIVINIVIAILITTITAIVLIRSNRHRDNSKRK